MKTNCTWKVAEIDIEQNILSKYIIAKYLPVADWMESVIPIMRGTGYEDFKGWDCSMEAVVIYCEAPLTHFRFENRPNWKLNGKTVETISPSLIWLYIKSLNPWRTCFKLHWAILTILIRGFMASHLVEPSFKCRRFNLTLIYYSLWQSVPAHYRIWVLWPWRI